MSFIKTAASAFGKLLTVVVLAAAFGAGMVFVVYRSLQGEEVKVPEIVGKNFLETERELESLGLKVKKRADRYSEEQPDTILEQLPRPGETVKTGQLILVVTAKRNPDGEEKPATIQKNQPVQDDTEKIEELISDKPKKKAANTNANTAKKKSSTTRDVIGDNSNSNTSTSGNKNASDADKNANKDKKDDAPSTPKPSTPANTAKPPAAKSPSPGAGDTRPRRNP